MVSVSATSTAGAAPAEVARSVMPHPALSAPRTLIPAAPVIAREPATTITAPAEYLWAGSFVRGTRPLRASRSAHDSEGPASASGGVPGSTATVSPACSRPGEITHPTFAAWAQTVRSARTASPATSPVEPPTPEGTSTAPVVPPASVSGRGAAGPLPPHRAAGGRPRRAVRAGGDVHGRGRHPGVVELADQGRLPLPYL